VRRFGRALPEEVDLNGTHLWTRHYRHSKIKINISRHGRKLAFQLRSEEWLTRP
jgi:hypothetical protein